MKSKKHDLAWLTGRISVDLQDATEKLIDIALNRLHDRDLANEIAAVVDDLEGLKGIIYNAVAAPNFKAAAEESARNTANRTEKGVTLDTVRETVEKYRRKRMEEIEANPRDGYPETAWKSGLAEAFNIKSYAHTLKPKLPALGITEAQIVAYLRTGQW